MSASIHKSCMKSVLKKCNMIICYNSAPWCWKLLFGNEVVVECRGLVSNTQKRSGNQSWQKNHDFKIILLNLLFVLSNIEMFSNVRSCYEKWSWYHDLFHYINVILVLHFRFLIWENVNLSHDIMTQQSLWKYAGINS